MIIKLNTPWLQKVTTLVHESNEPSFQTVTTYTKNTTETSNRDYESSPVQSSQSSLTGCPRSIFESKKQKGKIKTQQDTTEVITEKDIEDHRERIRKNIEYYDFDNTYNFHTGKKWLHNIFLDEIVEIMVDTHFTVSPTMWVSKQDKHSVLVKGQFLKLKSKHICFVIEQFNKQAEYISNCKDYLFTMLYNSI